MASKVGLEVKIGWDAAAAEAGAAKTTAAIKRVGDAGKGASSGINASRDALADLGARGPAAAAAAGAGLDSLGAAASRLTPLLAAAAGALSFAAALPKLTAVQRELDILTSSLETVTGSAGRAEQNFAWLKEFAATTPFGLAEVTNAFIKMKSLGLDASAAALRSYGNTATAMGKGLDQMIEAVADAATGEFERLKEFGIKSSVEGNRVTLTFRGVSTTIGNSSEEIVGYLRKIGDVDFAGAATKRAETLDGAISQLGDTWDELFRTINASGVGAAIEASVRGATTALERLTRNVAAVSSYFNLSEQQQVDQLVASREMWQKRLASPRGRDADYAANARAEVEAINAQIAALQRRFEVREADNRKADEADARAKASAASSAAEAKAKEAATAAAKAHEQAVKALAAAEAERLKTLQANTASESERAAALAADADKLREEIATLGLSAAQLADYQVAKLEAAAAAELLSAANLREAASAIQGGEAADQARKYYLDLAAAREAAAQALTDQAGLVAIKAEKQASIDAATAAQEAAKKAAADAENQWRQASSDINRSLTDALLRGFESGKSFAENLRDTVVNMFQTMVLRPVISAVLSPVSGAVASVVGASPAYAGTAAAPAGIGSWLNAGSSASSAYTAFSGGFSPAYASFATSTVGQSLGLSAAQSAGYMAPVYGPGGQLISAGTGGSAGGLTASGQALGTGLSYVGAGLAGIAVGSMIGGDKKVGSISGSTSSAVGAVIGGIVGGPLGAFVDGVAGGVFNAAFGMGAKKYSDTRLTGAFGEAGFSGSWATDWKQEGGWFRSDKSGTNYQALTSAQDKAFDSFVAGARGVFDELIKVSGDAQRSLSGWSFAVNRVVKTEAEQQQLIIDMANSLGQRLAPELVALRAEGEALADTAVRLKDEFLLTSRIADLLGKDAATAFGSVGMASLALRDNLITLMGGIESAALVTQSYYDGYFSSQEKLANDRAALAGLFDSINVVMPETRAEFRALVESMDLATKSGQATFSALMSVAAQFGAVADAAAEAAAADESALHDAMAGATSAVRSLFASIQDAASSARDAVSAARIGITGTALSTPEQIRARIAAAAIEAPDASDVIRTQAAANAAYASLQAAQMRDDSMLSALMSARRESAAAAASATEAQAARTSAIAYYSDLGQQFRGTAGAYGVFANASEGGSYYPGRHRAFSRTGSYLGNAISLSTNAYAYDPSTNRLSGFAQVSMAEGNRHDHNYNPAPFLNAVSGLMSILDGANAALSAADNAVASSLSAAARAQTELSAAVDNQSATAAELVAAQEAATAAGDAAAAAQTAYAEALRDYVGDAGKAVVQLGRLREQTVAWYESQQQLAQTMLGSAASLRDAARGLRLVQLSPEELLRQRRAEFDAAYRGALASTGAAQAGYADKMAGALPELADSLASAAGSRVEWARSVGVLMAQSNAVAAALEASAPKDYQAESLALLNTIDGTLSAIETASASAEKIISDAIYETGGKTVDGLRAVIAAISGEPIPAFAGGGMFSGGLRLVGERGPELEATGPARIWSADQTRRLLSGGGDNGALLAELRALRAEVAALRQDNSAENRSIAWHAQTTASVLDSAARGQRPLKTEVAA